MDSLKKYNSLIEVLKSAEYKDRVGSMTPKMLERLRLEIDLFFTDCVLGVSIALFIFPIDSVHLLRSKDSVPSSVNMERAAKLTVSFQVRPGASHHPLDTKTNCANTITSITRHHR